ncbi:hypothetical protein KUTeg_007528 [Tegillarca granosa]|uniref:Aminopeptidase N-like N-terminal domain-containing protein n=1 Tax=Tegillarca granosa TaxID=220873 RepID=A0ABQ9FDI7_TEGGR|nr:hypothetical protein KUTeg_007528 [Tegillarca granosa]
MNESEFYFEGYVKIDITCIESTSEVVLHMKDLTITENGYFSEHDEVDHSPLFVGHTYDEKRQFLIIRLTNQTTVGLNYSIELNFTGPLTKDLTGLYLSSFERDNRTEYLVATQFQATDARSAFPCFDEPGIKSTLTRALLSTKKRSIENIEENMQIQQIPGNSQKQH